MGVPLNKAIASPFHTVSVLAILAAFCGWGAFNAAHLRATGSAHHLAIYLQTFAFEWLLLAFIIWGVRRRGAPLASVLGERWSSSHEFWHDLRVAAGYWAVSLIALGLLSHFLGIRMQRENVRFLLPRGPVEIALWVAVAVTAGICEEAIFRGYLQRQFLAWTGYAPAAIVLGSVAFGAGHIYQGYRSAVLITCYGAMFGVLAHWRKTVRPGMIAHAWQDTLSGILGSYLR